MKTFPASLLLAALLSLGLLSGCGSDGQSNAGTPPGALKVAYLYHIDSVQAYLDKTAGHEQQLLHLADSVAAAGASAQDANPEKRAHNLKRSLCYLPRGEMYFRLVVALRKS